MSSQVSQLPPTRELLGGEGCALHELSSKKHDIAIEMIELNCMIFLTKFNSAKAYNKCNEVKGVYHSVS
jgi:hypothetical protein